MFAKKISQKKFAKKNWADEKKISQKKFEKKFSPKNNLLKKNLHKKRFSLYKNSAERAILGENNATIGLGQDLSLG